MPLTCWRCLLALTHALFWLHNHEMCVQRGVCEGPQCVHYEWACTMQGQLSTWGCAGQDLEHRLGLTDRDVCR